MINEKKLDVSCVELYSLKLQYFSDDKSDVFEFLSDSWKPLSMENLVVVYSAFKEIFSSLPKFNQSYRLRSHFLSKLRGLELQNLQRLVSIGFEQSWMKPFVEKLETIFVKECHCLTNLTPSDKQVSFSHLTELKVEDCCRLEYLFSSSTAKTLQVLKKMHVSNCESVQNIVATEDENSITFRQLQLLSLKLLPKLESFYSGSSKLNFPSLNEVSITECHNMEVFCSGEAITEWLTLTIDGVYMRGDLNDVIKKR
ncbi:hypothetical protein L195_g015254 [Trifolium pratense]|uniref:Disease resistance protein At4g27190-like leucine-rich repeats domain-containing protein n=3 Tax=Trifolium pratense TaxID=57577 RepID=A0A2K3MMW6_TRIPR|nr:hypothetical protein L195_g015254 [Trifolium pratense]